MAAKSSTCGMIKALGESTSVGMVLLIFIIGILSGRATAQAAYLSLSISAGWLVLSSIYFVVIRARQGRHIIPPVASSVRE